MRTKRKEKICRWNTGSLAPYVRAHIPCELAMFSFSLILQGERRFYVAGVVDDLFLSTGVFVYDGGLNEGAQVSASDHRRTLYPLPFFSRFAVSYLGTESAVSKDERTSSRQRYLACLCFHYMNHRALIRSALPQAAQLFLSCVKM